MDVDDPAMLVADFVDALSSDTISPHFRASLTRISEAPRHPAQKPVFDTFNLSRFCEFRAAFAAHTQEHTESVGIAKPNSQHDRLRADVLIRLHGEEKFRPFQVKASKHKRNEGTQGASTMVQGVWKMSLQELSEFFTEALE